MTEKDPLSFSLSNIEAVLWTITQRCNLRCSYCDIVNRNGPPVFEPQLSDIDFAFNSLKQLSNLSTLIITGGEALVSPNVEYVLKTAREMGLKRYLITNGVHHKNFDVIVQEKPTILMTIDSLDEEYNAKTRGKGMLGRSISNAKKYIDAGIYLVGLMVVTKHNISTVVETIEGLRKIGFKEIGIQQLHCSTRNSVETFKSLNPTVLEYENLSLEIIKYQSNHSDILIDTGEICFFQSRREAYTRKCDPKELYKPQRVFMCGAGYEVFAIKVNGDVVPCNAMLDHICGNIYRDSIQNILVKSKNILQMRHLRETRVDQIDGCMNCDFNPICDGGCRADAYNLTGEWFSPHPNCPELV